MRSIGETGALQAIERESGVACQNRPAGRRRDAEQGYPHQLGVGRVRVSRWRERYAQLRLVMAA